MKANKPDTFQTSNTPDTTAADNTYSLIGTQSEHSILAQYAQKNEIVHLREIFNLKFGTLDEKITSIHSTLNSRENKFWIINGIIIAAIIAIFLFALPLLYKHDYSEKYESLNKVVQQLDLNIRKIENKIFPIKKSPGDKH